MGEGPHSENDATATFETSKLRNFDGVLHKQPSCHALYPFIFLALQDVLIPSACELKRRCNQQHPETSALRQARGVGPLLLLIYVATIEDPARLSLARGIDEAEDVEFGPDFRGDELPAELQQRESRLKKRRRRRGTKPTVAGRRAGMSSGPLERRKGRRRRTSLTPKAASWGTRSRATTDRSRWTAKRT